jgi:hypothetical protein
MGFKNKPYWQTTTKPSRREQVRWPTWGLIVRQLGVLLVIAVLWGGLFAGFIGLTTSRTELVPTEVPAVVAATETPIPTGTPTPLPTSTPEPASTQENPIETDTPIPTSTPTKMPLPATDTPAPVEETAQISFANDVLPIFDRRCFNCHGGEKVENDFSVETYEALMKGSWNGPVLEPGDPNSSYLVELIESGDMPNRGPRLLPAEIEAIRAWIEAGAPNN